MQPLVYARRIQDPVEKVNQVRPSENLELIHRSISGDRLKPQKVAVQLVVKDGVVWMGTFTMMNYR